MPEKLQILIIDDEVDMCWALENILILDGYRVRSVTSGKEGLELLRQLYPNIGLVFLDAKLTDMDGLKLAGLIKQEYPGIKIAILSGYYYRDNEVIQQGIMSGLFDFFIGKPFNISEIRATLGMSSFL